MRISDWSSDVCSSDLFGGGGGGYCRTCSAVRADSLSGIACRRDGEWRLRMTSAPEGRQADAADYRMAGADDLIMQSAQTMMRGDPLDSAAEQRARAGRSEEHTSELQSLMRTSYAVFCLKKKTNTGNTKTTVGIDYPW